MRISAFLLLALAGSCSPPDLREEAATRCRAHYDRLWRWIAARGAAPADEEELHRAAGIDGPDPWGNPYVIERNADEYRVWSNGPDGEPGTEDDIVYPS